MQVLSNKSSFARILLAVVIASTGFVSAAGTCSDPPSFDVEGSTCPASRQDRMCACSETMTWNPVADADWYQITRCEADTDASGCLPVGVTKWRNRGVTNTDGVYHAETRPTVWLFAWDTPFPRPGTTYEYAVKACRAGAKGSDPICSTEFSNWVRYTTAPYMCVENGTEVACATAAGPSFDAGDTDGDGIPDDVDLDDDDDGVEDSRDGCRRVANPGQRDGDGDGIPDACDNCPLAANPDQADSDDDGFPDACDNCPARSNPWQTDSDGDGIGNACDNCREHPNAMQSDLDRDGRGDACDNCPVSRNTNQVDSDGDGAGDECDSCPSIHDPDQVDRDGDGVGDACDSCPDGDALQTDRDGDGFEDACDLCPNVHDPDQEDGDFDGIGDDCDNCALASNTDQDDVDHDGVGDVCDNCEIDTNASQVDLDGDGLGDRCDESDGLIYVYLDDPVSVSWQREQRRTSFNVYAGDLSVLRDGGPYTQRRASNPLAWRECRLKVDSVLDASQPPPGSGVFYLVTGRSGGTEDPLGHDSDGSQRPNTSPCR